jgi:DNA-binding NarL/FixJ family response regulator
MFSGTHSFRRWLLIYGTALGGATLFLKVVENEYYAKELRLEMVMAALAIVFILLGFWIGNTFYKAPAVAPVQEQPSAVPVASEAVEYKMDISPREYEVLQLMALGQSNQEIADNLYISLSTVKTHTTNIYAKLDVKRRTQAVQKAKELNILS